MLEETPDVVAQPENRPRPVVHVTADSGGSSPMTVDETVEHVLATDLWALGGCDNSCQLDLG